FAKATREAIEAARAGIDQVKHGDLAGEARLDAYDEATATLGTMMNLASLVSKAHPDPDTRAAAEAAEQELDKVATAISLDREVYEALREVDLSGADPATRHWVERTLRDFRRAGVDRD